MVRALGRSSATTGVICCLALAGCISWRVQGVAPEQVIETEHPNQMRVIRLDGERVTLNGPAIEQDSLVGRWHHRRLAIPLADVKAVALRHPNTAGSLAIVLATVAVGLFVWAAATPW